MLAAIGEFERDLIKKRAAEGIARAKAASVRFGERPKLSADDIAALKAECAMLTTNRKELARRYGISRVSVHGICTAMDGVRCTPADLTEISLLSPSMGWLQWVTKRH